MKHNRLISMITFLGFGLYILSDIIELFSKALTPGQQILTYVAMLMIPFSMMGLYALDHKKGGLPLLIGMGLIAMAFVYFAGTALYAFAENEANYGSLIEKLKISYLFHGILLAIGEILFSWVAFRKLLYPKLAVSMILISALLNLVSGGFQLSEFYYIVANFLRNFGFCVIAITLWFDRRLGS